ncbi:MAG: PmbA/TldA family metallopeptidase, partial [Candidatus Heimdallarchaeota archaeon]
MLDKIKHILEKHSFKTGDFADIRLQKGCGTLITIQNGRPEQINYEKEIGVGIRALIDGGWGFVSVVSFDLTKIEEALQKAIKIARATAKKTTEKGMMIEDFAVVGKHKVNYKKNPRDISIEQKYEVVQEYEKVTREYSDKVVS